jgi:hypothetical protein
MARHATRFIILVSPTGKGQWTRSVNDGLSTHFPTVEAAQAALDTPGLKSERLFYKVRQK